jgi:hypothetical protein
MLIVVSVCYQRKPLFTNKVEGDKRRKEQQVTSLLCIFNRNSIFICNELLTSVLIILIITIERL